MGFSRSKCLKSTRSLKAAILIGIGPSPRSLFISLYSRNKFLVSTSRFVIGDKRVGVLRQVIGKNKKLVAATATRTIIMKKMRLFIFIDVVFSGFIAD
jgi:hypothetical protein